MKQITEAEKHILDDLWKRYAATKQAEYRDELIVLYLHLVKISVGKLATTMPTYVKLDDLYSSGVTGLIKAVEKFEPTKNIKFETYALLLIKGAIIDELRELDWIPRSVHQKAHSIASAEQLLQEKLGRDPTDLEISEQLGLTQDAYTELLDRVRPAILISLNADAESQDEEALPISERIADERAETSFEIAKRNEFHSLLEKAITDLPEQEKRVLVLYYYEELMLKEIGKIIGVSESRVSQIHTKAILKLRGKLKAFAAEFALKA